MKLASYKDGSRDGQLVVVSRDLATAHYATGIATRLQQVLDDWNFLSPQLEDVSSMLNQGRARHGFAFDATKCMAPLPRAYQWASSSAYLHPMALEQGVRPADLQNRVLMRQGGSDHFLGPCDDIVVASEQMGVDFEAGVAVITGDVSTGCSANQALDSIRLLMLVNDVSLQHLIACEIGQGWGLVQSKPATAFSPVAVTPDELGGAWQQGRLNLPLHCTWNGKRVGLCDAGADMSCHFGELIAHLSKTRAVRAGSIIGGGAVRGQDAQMGYCCIAHKRALEALVDGSTPTDFMKYGDTIRIEMKGLDTHSVFGAIDQTLRAPGSD